jgi:hypothetical protein
VTKFRHHPGELVVLANALNKEWEQVRALGRFVAELERAVYEGRVSLPDDLLRLLARVS